MSAQQVACGILDLTLGPLDLNLLGLRVKNFFGEKLSSFSFFITAIPGGGLLGDLLCAEIAGLLDPLGPLRQLVALLNRLLGICSTSGGPDALRSRPLSRVVAPRRRGQPQGRSDPRRERPSLPLRPCPRGSPARRGRASGAGPDSLARIVQDVLAPAAGTPSLPTAARAPRPDPIGSAPDPSPGALS